MARYIGPKTKVARKFGEAIFGEDSYFEKRNYPPGQHGMARRRAKRSEYATQLQEKQKAKYTYGILERQFHNMFERAQRSKGITGEVLLQLCESRLDNVVFRLGIAPTRRCSSVGQPQAHYSERKCRKYSFVHAEGWRQGCRTRKIKITRSDSFGPCHTQVLRLARMERCC